MEAALTALLLTDGQVAAAVGTRVHWHVLPAQASGRPYVNLTIVDGPDPYDYDGVSDLRQWEVQVDCWGDTAGQAFAAAEACRARLSGYRGTVAGVKFRAIFVTRSLSAAAEGTGGDGQLHRRSFDIMISWLKE